jgi:PDZ domain
MSTHKRNKMMLVGAMLSCVWFSSSASSRPWKPTPTQIAADYASITHIKGNGDVVTIGWWASPTARPGTQLVALLENYVLISVIHSHQNLNQPAAGTSFDDIKTLEARGESGKALTIVPRDALPPASTGLLTAFEAGYRRGLGPRGNGVRFFLFDGGSVRACERGGISVPFDGETYTWETPFPGCSGDPTVPLAPVYGRLGVRFQLVTEDIVAIKKLTSTRGVLVTDIDDTGAAKPAGIQVGDVIIRMNEKDIADIRDLPRIVAETPADKRVDVAIIRDGEERTFSVTLGR